MDQDLLGHPTTDVERDVARLYGELKALVAREDAPPCVQRNAAKALACLWQACNDLDLSYEQLYDVGV
jgi:hypothetical protein